MSRCERLIAPNTLKEVRDFGGDAGVDSLIAINTTLFCY
ncbi:hypothetical protein AC520_0807 [Enterobacter sp. OLF]|nr:hypothetical protein AC520_0807 [Enterobacter sp. OLF]